MKNEKIETTVEAQVVEETPVEKKTRSAIRFRNPFVKEKIDTEFSNGTEKKSKHEKKKISLQFGAGFAAGVAVGALFGQFIHFDGNDESSTDYLDEEDSDSDETENEVSEDSEVTEE